MDNKFLMAVSNLIDKKLKEFQNKNIANKIDAVESAKNNQ